MKLGSLVNHWMILQSALFFLFPGASASAVTVEDRTRETIVSGSRFRLTFVRESADLTIEVRDREGQWHVVTKPAAVAYAFFRGDEDHSANGARATWAKSATTDTVTIGQQIVLDRASSATLELHYICRDDGVLIGARLINFEPNDAKSTFWAPPRLTLAPKAWDSYLFWGPEGKAHTNLLGNLQPFPAYAGVSPWEQRGDTVRNLSTNHPALILQSSAWNIGMGVVFLDYAARWTGVHSFLQRHMPGALLFYPGYAPVVRGQQTLWAWLTFFPVSQPDNSAAQVDTLVREGDKLIHSFKPIAAPAPQDLLKPVPDFPPELRRKQPVNDLNDAVVFTMNETTASDYAMNLARRSGSDMLIRGWFKWNQAPPVESWRNFPEQAHQLAALFGGGITCSALYDRENGLTQAQVLDMATRGPDGQLVDAWDQPGIRHGSLSSPAYLDYLFRWCREQIDAGVDYLFMDEHTAALGSLEGYDDHSLNDFRRFLLEHCPQTRDWKRDDPRWKVQFQIDLDDPRICPGGNMDSFNYRAFLRAKNLLAKPVGPGNPLAPLWHQCRAWRDDRAWKELTDRIRDDAHQKGRRVFISANGLARYVDLQVLGVWDQWLVKDGQIDLAQNQLPYWRGLVTQGHELAGQRVPVVLFHDWGMGDVPFPWLAVPPSQREIWLRTRGAEIYAAGAFFAFPVLGPFGCDAARDGTLSTIARQTAFFQSQRELFSHGRYLGSECLRSSTTDLSMAAWAIDQPRAVVLHVINRAVKDGRLQPRSQVTVEVPLDRAPARSSAVSPDWEGGRTVKAEMRGDKLRVTLDDLEAYAVVTLNYDQTVNLSRLKDPVRVRLTARWERPARSECRVRSDASVENASDLNGYLQGMLHTHLRNPPIFLVNSDKPATLRVHVRAVAQAGAKLEYRVDGRVERIVDLPDLDGKNDGGAAEYDRAFTFPVPAGVHRLTLDNIGPDWAVLTWLAFEGEFKE